MSPVVDDGENLRSCRSSPADPTERTSNLSYIGAELIWRCINSDSLDEYKVAFPDIGLHVTYLLQSFSVRASRFRPTKDPKSSGPRGKKGSEFQYFGRGGRLLRTADLQSLGHQHRKNLHPTSAWHCNRCARRTWRRSFLLQPSPSTLSFEVSGNLVSEFLPVSYDSKFEDYYLPAFVEASDYPALVKSGERVATLAVPTVLATYNWPVNSNRISGWLASPTISSAVSASCRSPASIPTGSYQSGRNSAGP